MTDGVEVSDQSIIKKIHSAVSPTVCHWWHIGGDSQSDSAVPLLQVLFLFRSFAFGGKVEADNFSLTVQPEREREREIARKSESKVRKVEDVYFYRGLKMVRAVTETEWSDESGEVEGGGWRAGERMRD